MKTFKTFEGTWALPQSSKQKKELKDLLKKPIKLGKDGDEASDKMYNLIGDDSLFDDLYVAGKKNPKGDARSIIKKHMKRLNIKESITTEANNSALAKRAMKRFKGIDKKMAQRIANAVKPKGMINSKLYVELGDLYDKKDMKGIEALLKKNKA